MDFQPPQTKPVRIFVHNIFGLYDRLFPLIEVYFCMVENCQLGSLFIVSIVPFKLCVVVLLPVRDNLVVCPWILS